MVWSDSDVQDRSIPERAGRATLFTHMLGLALAAQRVHVVAPLLAGARVVG